jgi:lysophospholipase L1-like esterase
VSARRQVVVEDGGRTITHYLDDHDALLFATIAYTDQAGSVEETYNGDWSLAGATRKSSHDGRTVFETFDAGWSTTSATISYTDSASGRFIEEQYGAGWTFNGAAIWYEGSGGRSIRESYDAHWSLTSAKISYTQEGGHHTIENYGAGWQLRGATDSVVINGQTVVQSFDQNWGLASATITAPQDDGSIRTHFFDGSWHWTGMNTAPTGLALGQQFVNEGSAWNTAVSTLIATDPDAGDRFTYALVADSGGDNHDNALFYISGNQIYLNSFTFLNAASDATLDIHVKVSDDKGATFTDTLQLHVIRPDQEDDFLVLDHASASENADGASIGNLLVRSGSVHDLEFKVLTAGTAPQQEGQVDSRFVVDGDTLKLAAGTSLNYEKTPTIDIVVRATNSAGESFDQAIEIAVEDVNPWAGHTYGVIGDSITAYQMYQWQVVDEMDVSLVYNDGVPGRRMADALINWDNGHEIDDVDLLTIFLGTNDYGGNRTLGSYQDTSADQTFYGDTRRAIEAVLDHKPGIELVMITPPMRGAYPDQPINPAPNASGAYLWQYVEAIQRVAADYDVTVIDAYHDSGIGMDNLADLTFDNLHPNAAGQALLADLMMDSFELI